jgi:hypothetical protein
MSDDKAPSIRIDNAVGDLLLKESNHSLFVLYYLLRKKVDFKTGIVGANSYNKLKEVKLFADLNPAPTQGKRPKQQDEKIKIKQIRYMLKRLVTIGVLRKRSDLGYMIFDFPLEKFESNNGVGVSGPKRSCSLCCSHLSDEVDNNLCEKCIKNQSSAETSCSPSKGEVDHEVVHISGSISGTDINNTDVLLGTEEKKSRKGKKQKAQNEDDMAEDNCAHKEIIKLYHEILPMLPKVLSWEGSRRTNLRARWHQKGVTNVHGEPQQTNTLEFWERYFRYISRSKWLTGQKLGRNGKPFKKGLHWYVELRNFQKVLESEFHDPNE